MTCHHPDWESGGTGEARCKHCGTRRFTDYGALRPPRPTASGAPTGP
ncbi:DUF6255 family natural product biosynthesis protein [Streptomyces sp. C36]